MVVERNTPAGSPLVMGRISRPHGIRGWLHITTFTERPENILAYQPWYLQRQNRWEAVELVDSRDHGKGLVVKLAGCNDRDAAELLKGSDIGIYREQLPASKKNEYYWRDLVGMQVVTREGRILGQVDHLLATGANDVLVVKGDEECLVPFIRDQVIESVDPDSRIIRVDWDPDY